MIIEGKFNTSLTLSFEYKNDLFFAAEIENNILFYFYNKQNLVCIGSLFKDSREAINIIDSMFIQPLEDHIDSLFGAA